MPFLPLPPRTVGALGRKRFVGEFHTRGGHTALCCRLISSFYIKPQLWLETISLQIIVLYRLSTSNHNSIISLVLMRLLSYIVFLHQTTTRGQLGDDRENCLISSFYIKPQQPIQGYCLPSYCLISSFYIKPQHVCDINDLYHYCLISSFYIKPQPSALSRCSRVDCLISSFYIKPQPLTKAEKRI